MYLLLLPSSSSSIGGLRIGFSVSRTSNLKAISGDWFGGEKRSQIRHSAGKLDCGKRPRNPRKSRGIKVNCFYFKITRVWAHFKKRLVK